MEVVCSREAAE